jgi:RNA polymerase sigma factor for flagellar operon FliA
VRWAGLRVALRNFDPELGYAFSTYACPKINGAIRDGVRAESPIPKHLTTFVRKVSAAEESLVQALGRPPTYLEIATFLDASLEEMSNPWGDATREPACLVDAADPATSAITCLRNEALASAVASLPADEADAVRLLLLQDMPVTAAAAILGIEPRTLRALKTRALTRLEPIMRAWVDVPVTV